MAHELSAVAYETVPRTPVRWHPFAELFPWIEGVHRDELRASIRAHGVVEPIVFLGDQLLDGRNRYDVSRELGVAYPRVDYLGDDPLGFVIAKNLERRHLTDQQRAMVAARLAKLPRGRRAQSAPTGAVSTADAARMMDVSARSVVRAKTVQREGAPDLVAAVEAGAVSLAAGVDIAALPVDKQMEVIKAADPKALSAVVKEARAAKQRAKKDRRQERERTLAAKQRDLPNKKYGLIYADPAWKWVPHSEETGMDRAAENHYPTMTLDQIMQLDVGRIAADDSILLLWARVPMLMEAICAADAWGFCWLDRDTDGKLRPVVDVARYVSQIAWLKESIITGYWNRGKHEILLIFTRGTPIAPAMGDQLPSWVEGDALRTATTDHSAKPEQILEWIERMWPNTPKIELNRRGAARPGWDAWGNEAEPEVA